MHTGLKSCTFPIADFPGLKKKVLNWLRPFNTFCFLDNHQYNTVPHGAECLVAAGVRQQVEGNDIKSANDFFKEKDWLFGHLSYELKNTLHQLSAQPKEDKIGFPCFFFFEPQVVLELNNESLTIHADEPAIVCKQIINGPEIGRVVGSSSFEAKPVLCKDAYIQKIKALQAHIRQGDCYEINFCQAFFAEGVKAEPFVAFEKLMDISPNPFSAFYRLGDKFLLCASPERFLAKRGNRIVSQPIKGTMHRDLGNKDADEALKSALKLSPKEQAENVMVVDLVRNDLTKICKPATVKVDELFGIYSFPQVHQMISTISGEIKDEISLSQLLEATFPMGSMTGAPKFSVMNLIDEYETSARGIFSGSVGYKKPGGDFDFNVIIRSIMYNDAKGVLSYQVGSGITFYSDPEKEWDECMLKAAAMKKVLE